MSLTHRLATTFLQTLRLLPGGFGEAVLVSRCCGLPARVGFAAWRFFAGVLAVVWGISGSAWALTSGDFTYTDSGTAVTITAYTGAGGTVAIPSSIGGHPVTTIADGVFNNKTAVTGISIPSSVTTVGSAFQGSGLTSLTLPGTVTSWGPYTFADCHSLVSLTIASGVTTITSEMFERCDYLTSVVFPTSITSIGWYAFYGCSRLSSVTFLGAKPTFGSGGVFVAIAASARGYYPSGSASWSAPAVTGLIMSVTPPPVLSLESSFTGWEDTA